MDLSIGTTAPVVWQPTKAFNEFWRFASERHQMFERRLRGEPAPWSTCPVLSSRKFCNTFRILDRTSQYLLRHVIYEPGATKDPIEVTFRTLLFKFFNFIPCWEQLVTGLGALPEWRIFDINTFGQILDAAKAAGKQIWSGGAYQQASSEDPVPRPAR